MKESINTIFKVNESTALCDLLNWSLDILTERIALVDCVPSIVLKLLKAEGYSLLVEIIAKDLCLNDITDGYEILRVRDSLSP